MTPEMMGLSAITRMAWYLFFKPKTIVGIVSRQLTNSGGILAITSDSTEPADFEAGPAPSPGIRMKPVHFLS